MQDYTILQEFEIAICLQDSFALYIYVQRDNRVKISSNCHVILLGELLSALLHSASYYFLPKCRLCAGTRTFI